MRGGARGVRKTSRSRSPLHLALPSRSRAQLSSRCAADRGPLAGLRPRAELPSAGRQLTQRLLRHDVKVLLGRRRSSIYLDDGECGAVEAGGAPGPRELSLDPARGPRHRRGRGGRKCRRFRSDGRLEGLMDIRRRRGRMDIRC